MIAVGIDVSKSKSTVAILNADGTKHVTPFDVKHNLPELNALVKYLNDLNENIVILMFISNYMLKSIVDDIRPRFPEIYGVFHSQSNIFLLLPLKETPTTPIM